MAQEQENELRKNEEDQISSSKKSPVSKKRNNIPNNADEPTQPPGHKFSPYDLTTAPIITSGLPPELWTIVQSAPAAFTPQYFLDVSRNLLENPNLTASHLARAELSYQSFTDASFNAKARTSEELASIVKHLKPDHRPRLIHGVDGEGVGAQGYELEWTVVRKLIPRNPKLDEALLQTCHLFTSIDSVIVKSLDGEETTVKAERYLVVYIPHVDNPEAIPFYHPKVRSLGILYTFIPDHEASSSPLPTPGTLSIYYSLFPSYPLDNRLSRTGLKLMEIIHKHSRGRQAGYKKRVHHDQVIPQKTFQDTYAYLKGKYAKDLIDQWVEQTPPEKHVFEDLGIAAFLIELWIEMYGGKTGEEILDPSPKTDDNTESMVEKRRNRAQESFPGFVDIGCGNGLLVYILNAEGWHGWGFDARRRKTWDVFGPSYAAKLQELLLIPEILRNKSSPPTTGLPLSHNGVFPQHTFIVSNHADELTPWTPLLACLSESPFIAIPCCSHDFGGTRFRAPGHAKYLSTDPSTSGAKNKQPSAYAGLCSWVSHLTEEVGYEPEKEHLRIPSTRNIAILGRRRVGEVDGGKDMEERLEFAKSVVEKEMGGGTTIDHVERTWLERGSALMKPGKGGH